LDRVVVVVVVVVLDVVVLVAVVMISLNHGKQTNKNNPRKKNNDEHLNTKTPLNCRLKGLSKNVFRYCSSYGGIILPWNHEKLANTVKM
jgi:hypothetical protein